MKTYSTRRDVIDTSNKFAELLSSDDDWLALCGVIIAMMFYGNTIF